MLNIIAPGAVSSASNPILDFWTQTTITGANGFTYLGLSAPFALAFQVFNLSDVDNPVQVFPATTGQRHSVDLTADRVGGLDGHYAAAWTAALASPGKKGRHQIRWFVTPVSGDIEQSYARDFDILPAAAAVIGAGTAYALVSDLRDEGISVSDANDARLIRLLGMQARDRKSTRLNSSHSDRSRMPSSA